MLTISKPLSSAQAQAYHKLEFTSETQSYYKQGGAVEGQWQGQLADKFGLTGPVSEEAFARLADGKHPETEEQLVRHRLAQRSTSPDGKTMVEAVAHRAGWDATFSAPKSVSLTALVGGDDRVREAHREAVTVALTELERFTQARVGGNHPAETTGKFIAAKFEHDTARPVDGYAAPQLHTHAVIFNVTERDNGLTRALQEKSFFESQNYATAVYQSALTYRLKKLGYEIEAGRSGAPEIKGYSQAYLDASSPRRQQIEEAVAKSGYTGPEAAQIAAHATRDKKQILTPAEVLTAHREIALQHGNQVDQVIASARQRAQVQELAAPTDRLKAAREAMNYAREHHFEREAVADERIIARDALRRGFGQATPEEILAEFRAQTEDGLFKEVPGAKYASARSFTTPETIIQERSNIAIVHRGKSAAESILSAEQAIAQASSRELLNASQRRVIEEVLTTRDRIHGLQGLAGTGKTTTLEAIREGAEKGGYAVEGFAPTARAASQLRDAGVNASTLQSFLARGQQEPVNPSDKHLYLLDESSLASTKQVNAFLNKLQPQDRVLLIGDTRQHQGVEAGKPFEQLQDAGLRTSKLDQIVRQKDPELLKAVQHLAKNETEAGVKLLREQERVTQVKDGTERIAAIAKDYAAKPENTLIVSPDNRSRQQINEAVREELKAKGTLARDGQELQRLTTRSDFTGADRSWAARYEVGNVLRYSKGSKAEGIERNSSATVVAIDKDRNTVTVEKADGQTVTYDPKRLRGVTAYREAVREIATGDRIQFTAADRKLGIVNREIGVVQEQKLERMTVQLPGQADRVVSFDPRQFRNIDHGYAVTSHSAQGLTTERVLANIDTDGPRGLINSRLAYVAVSRASQDARIYTNNADELGKALSSDVSKTSALGRKHHETYQPTPAERLKDALETLGKNDTERGVAMLREQGRIHEYADPNHRLAAISTDFARGPARSVVVSPDPNERKELTTLIRQELGRSEALNSPILIEKGGSRLRAQSYAPGNLIRYKAGDEELGIAPDSTATVREVKAKNNLITVDTAAGEQVSYRLHQAKALSQQSTLYRVEQREFAPNERVRFTAPVPEHSITNRAFGTVSGRSDDGRSLDVTLDSGKRVQLTPDQAKHLDYGYAVSSPARADRVFFNVQDPAQLNKDSQLYTALSRTKDAVLYTNDVAALTREPAVKLEPPSREFNFSHGPELAATEQEIVFAIVK